MMPSRPRRQACISIKVLAPPPCLTGGEPSLFTRSPPARSHSCRAPAHLAHFADHAWQDVDELLGSVWPETVALGIGCRSLQGLDAVPAGAAASSLPHWLVELELRQIVQASVRDESPERGPVPWIVELDFDSATASSINVWIKPDGSLYQLYLSDEPIGDLESFLGEINHQLSNRSFERILPAMAIDVFRAPAEHSATEPGDRAMLRWLLRTSFSSEQ